MADNLKNIKCPACQNEMIKVYVPEHGINIDLCVNGCGGIYFDNREFKLFDEQNENIDMIIEAFSNKSFIKVNENLQRVCPVCNQKMHKNFTSIKKEIQIDECYSCGGKFLDNNELEKIRQEYVTEKERVDDVMEYVHRVVGMELESLDKKVDFAKSNRSAMKAMYDAIFGLN